MWESGFQIPESFLGFFYPLSLVSSNSNILVFFYFIITPWKTACFFMRDRKGVDQDRRGEGETIISTYKNIYFQ